jgi:cobalt-zinc-cadmium efflux system outer membrane protein
MNPFRVRQFPTPWNFRMFRLLLLIGLAAAAGLVHAESLNAESALTFDAALELAALRAPDLAAESANVDSARSASISAGSLPDPKLIVGVENLPVNGPDAGSFTQDFMTMRKVGLMQEVPNGDKRRARIAVAAAGVNRAETERRVALLTVRQATALAWLDRYYLERRSALFDALERDNQLLAQTVQAQFAAGRGMAADVIVPKQEAAELADRRDEVAAEIARSKATLRRWVGSAADVPLAGDPPSLALDPQHLRGHVHEHPELAVFASMIEMAQADVHEAEAAKKPDWGVELSYGRRGIQFSDMVNLQFTFDLPLFTKTRQDPRIAEKRALLSRAEAQREAMLREHVEDLDAQLAQYDVLNRQLARIESTRLPLARQKVDYQAVNYRSGKGDLSALFMARRELLDEQLRQIQMQGQQAAVVAKLHFIYGEGAR